MGADSMRMSVRNVVGDGHAKDIQVVLAWLGRVIAEGALQELNMGVLVLADLREPRADPRREAGLLEVAVAVLGESAGVERVLEVFEGERKLQDVGVCHAKAWSGNASPKPV